MHPNKEGWVYQFDVILPCRTIFRLQRNFPRIFSWKSTLSNNILKCCSENPWILGAICIKRMVRVTLIQCERERWESFPSTCARKRRHLHSNWSLHTNVLVCFHSLVVYCQRRDDGLWIERVENYLSGLVWENWNNPQSSLSGRLSFTMGACLLRRDVATGVIYSSGLTGVHLYDRRWSELVKNPQANQHKTE